MNSKPNLKLFTVDQANRALPLVRAITGDLAELSVQVFHRQRHLAAVCAGREMGADDDPYSAELVHEQTELGRQKDRLHELIDELRELGAEPKTGPEGCINLVDFPSERDGRVVYLCWKLGEDSVDHWHEMDTGFSGRRSIVESVASGTTDSVSS